MENVINPVLKSVFALCDYMYKFEQLDVERLRINKEFEIMERKVSITERVALKHIEFQKLVLEKSLAAAAEDLARLAVSRETMIKAIEKFSLNIMAKDTSVAERECAFKLIGLLSHELKQLRSDSEIKFKLLSANIVKALQNPLGNIKTLDTGR